MGRLVRAVAVAAISAVFATGAQAEPQKASPEIQAAADKCFGKGGATWQQIIDSCSKIVALKVRPDIKAGAFYNRGSAYLKTGAASTKALADFNDALKIQPKFARALAARGGLYTGMGKYKEAIADFDAAIALDATSSAAFNNRGMAYLGAKDYAKAIADFTKSIELDPKDATSYTARGGAYAASGDKARAMADFDKAVSLDSKEAAALFNRALLLEEKGEKDKAKADFKAVLALVPDHKLAKERLAQLEKAG
jgi:tetratricopeptide (TPR) repeat protein